MTEKIPHYNFKRVFLSLSVLTTMASFGVFYSSIQTMPLLPAQVDIVATAQALQRQRRQAELAEKSQERIQILQVQIDQKQQSLGVLQRAGQTEQARLEAHLTGLQAQFRQILGELEQAEIRLVTQQQAIETTKTRNRAEILTLQLELQGTEQQLQAELGQISAELQAIDHHPDQPQPFVMVTSSVQVENHNSEDEGKEAKPPKDKQEGNDQEHEEEEEAEEEEKEEHKDGQEPEEEEKEEHDEKDGAREENSEDGD